MINNSRLFASQIPVRLICLFILLLPIQYSFGQSIAGVNWRPASAGDLGYAIAGSEFRIAFTVESDDLLVFGKVYLGCSYMNDEGQEIDLEAREINRFSSKEDFQCTVSSAATGIIFTLWQKKITPEVLEDLSQDEYQKVMSSHNESDFSDRVRRLKEIGYFMYDRIDSTGWLSLDHIDISEQPLGGSIY